MSYVLRFGIKPNDDGEYFDIISVFNRYIKSGTHDWTALYSMMNKRKPNYILRQGEWQNNKRIYRKDDNGVITWEYIEKKKRKSVVKPNNSEWQSGNRVYRKDQNGVLTFKFLQSSSQEQNKNDQNN